LVFGVTPDTTKGIFFNVVPEPRGIRPISVVTMGYQLFPATGETVQVICVVETTTMLAQST
jgi:hypothetical protein